jgi:small subunit ribosomal protein S4
MARYIGPKWRINRRENATVLGVSEKWRRRSAAPGQFPLPKKRPSDYAVQFREKQKVKRMYGMQEKQFRRFFSMAEKTTGNTGTRLLQLLELRADNVIFRLGLAKTRAQARQLVSHGNVLLNGRRHTVPSTVLGPNDELTIKPTFAQKESFKNLLAELEAVKVPTWLEKYSEGGKVLAVPTRDLLDQSIKERLIIELYSK